MQEIGSWINIRSIEHVKLEALNSGSAQWTAVKMES